MVTAEASQLMRQAGDKVGFSPPVHYHGAVPFYQVTPQVSTTSLVSSLSSYSSLSFPDSGLSVLVSDSSRPILFLLTFILHLM